MMKKPTAFIKEIKRKQAEKKAKRLIDMPGLKGSDPAPTSASAPSSPPQRRAKARAPPAVRLMDKAEVLAVVGCSFPTLWAWMRDKKFPRGLVRGGKTVWRSDEVQAWIAALPVRPLKGDDASVMARITGERP